MLKSLQACRGLAALVIVLYHAEHSIFQARKYVGTAVLGRLVDFAPGCLDFFFVLSGFIIMYAHSADIGRPRALASYLWRRFSRAYLFYWVILAAVVPVFFLVPSFGTQAQRDPDVIVRSILLIPHPKFHMVVDVAWTMVYEVFFYLAFAVLILNRRIGTAIFVGWILGALIHPWLGTARADFLFNPIHLRFAAGMLVCMAVQRWRIPAPLLLAGLGIGLFLAIGFIESFCGRLDAGSHASYLIVSSCLAIAGLTEAERSGKIEAPRALVYLGNAAFAIYLVHFLALSAIAKIAHNSTLDRSLPAGLLFLLYVVGAVGAGCVCHHLIENPLHVWSKRLFVQAKRTDRGEFAIEIRRAA